jgi:hypothetical protein
MALLVRVNIFLRVLRKYRTISVLCDTSVLFLKNVVLQQQNYETTLETKRNWKHISTVTACAENVFLLCMETKLFCIKYALKEIKCLYIQE